MIPISQWRPEGLSQNFPRKFIRIANVPGRENSGLSRVASKGNQNDFTKGLCFVVPIERYERVTSSGVRVVTTDSNRDCVAFTARTPDLLIEAQWFSGDDLDLSVIEPGGAVVSNSNIRTACGRFSIDAGVDSCRLFPQGTERISYGLSCSGFVRGDEYTAVLRHSNNCQDGPTRWELRIVLNGRLLSMKKGVSDARGGRKISMLKFSV